MTENHNGSYRRCRASATRWSFDNEELDKKERNEDHTHG